MKKVFLIFTLFLIIAVMLSGCVPKISEDTYNVMNIFTKSRSITYERTEGEAISDVVYNITVNGNIVSTEVTIDFEAGQFRSESEFNADTLIPISAAKGNSYALDPAQNWDIYAKYDDVLNMTAKTHESTEMKTLDLPVRYVDNEALLFTMGALEYKEDFEKNINVAVIDAGDIVTFRVSYMGLETVEVPYGNIECIKVEIKYIGLVLGAKPKMYMWYTNDNMRIPVMYKNRDIFLKLKSIN
ncbi:MAG: DUF3108 domain-containing protein [Clostridiales bacterium]|nr:DUF3108 domain-containing protein [Clostridiales bacterium]